MKKHSFRFLALMAGVLLGFSPQKSAALEMRSWLTIDGKIIEAELVRPLGDSVELRDKDNRVIKLPKSSLSFGDLDYVADNSPPDTTVKPLGSSVSVKPKLPNPAKDVKIDTKAFKKEAGSFKINSRTYKICETPHFQIMYLKPADPMGLAELAERLWIDTAFFHSTFIPKWHDRKMALVLVNDKEQYDDVGNWYADMLMDAGNKEGAERTRIVWPETSAGSVIMPAKQADAQKIFSMIQVFRNYRTTGKVDQNGKIVEQKTEMVKGVWVPFNTNVLAHDMIAVQSGGAGGGEGAFAVLKGHAYYKEILLNGKSETSIAQAQGSQKAFGTAGGFPDKNWAPELKKMIKKGGEWVPNLQMLMKVNGNSARTSDIVFSWAFAKFLQKSPESLSAFNKLCQKMDVANQVPDLEEIAKIYGLADAAALEKAWVDWMAGPEFH